MSEAEDFPRDILLSAANVVVMLPPFHSIEKTSDAVDRIAQAIMAERERCGKYATDQAEREPYGHCKATAYLIADSIMGGK